MERLVSHQPSRLLDRLFAASEKKAFRNARHPTQFFARCFAAKEAYFKASGGEWLGEEGFRSIEIVMEEEDRFRVVHPHLTTEGKFFETPDGVGAQVLLWSGQEA